MRRFRSPYIIRILDSAVVQEAAGDYSSGFDSREADSAGGKTVYLFLPFYPLGNVQDAIHRHVVNGTRYSEAEMLNLFLGTCKAVQAMHAYRLPSVPLGGRERTKAAKGQPAKVNQMSANNDQAPLIDGAADTGVSDPFGIDSDPDDDDDDDHTGAYPPKPSRDVKGKGKQREVIEQSSLGGEGTESGQVGDLVPYAHRDIKPG